jgi:hypothetical protein
MRRAVWGTAAAFALALCACGGDEDGATAVEDATVGDATPRADDPGGAYEGKLQDGSRLRVRLDVDPAEAVVAPFERLRVQTGAPDVTWILAEIEVPDDVEGTGRFITFVADGAEPIDDDPADDTDGVTNAEFACSVLDDWVSGADDPAASNVWYVELLEGACGGQTLQVLAPEGETTTYVMMYEGPLPHFDRIFAGLGTELMPP